MKQIDKDEILRNSVGLMLSFGSAMLIFSLILGMIHSHEFGPVIYFTTFLLIIDVLIVFFQYNKLVLFMEVVE